MSQSVNKFTNGARPTAWFGDEFESVPLKQRLKLLLANYRMSDPNLIWEDRFSSKPPTSDTAVAGKWVNGQCDSQHLQNGCSGEEQMSGTVRKDERHPGELGKSDNPENLANNCMSSNLTVSTAAFTATSEQADSLRESLRVQDPFTVKVEPADNHVESSSASGMSGFSQAGSQAAVNIEPHNNVEYRDDLDHVVLKERLRRLLARCDCMIVNFSLVKFDIVVEYVVCFHPFHPFCSRCSRLTPTALEFPMYRLITVLSVPQEICAGAVREGKQFGNRRRVLSGNQVHDIDRLLSSVASKATVYSSSKPHQGKRSLYAESLELQNDSEKRIFKSDSKKTLLSTNAKTVEVSPVSTLKNIKIEPPLSDDFLSMNANGREQMSYVDFLVKSEVKITDNACEDALDHMLLRDRIKLLSRDGSSLGVHQGLDCMSKTSFPAFVSRPVAPTPSQSFKVNRPRKRRKTVTDSLETAMEEDAPGLLKVLIGKGVTVDEIKLYGEPESDDALEDSSTEENFSELEEVISKLFSQSQRESLLKLGPTRGTKGDRVSYCLECLLSLVEQARYLRFRNWPVEWGWCRDLQSFIFVFERHNRLVLERPEYGYATYFFELVESFPIQWQIRRLVTAMKLTSCSRISLIENKALTVGDDISEGEARVLMGFGWIPNTGLGTMLNYFDRVVHDRRNERDRSEWRSKIGKLLADGLNGGTITSAAAISRNASESDLAHPVEIKIELN
ncbi:hypothetical protein STAS_24163 [Striga asiatica]|uniref:Uncharacterized protein n=1 Tax=Striga asiatica TaxID=4170 RepID=A0A5A7QNZ2_STRAF|nr:hypothetical protein STAS_24163 [Striga asiatica]